MLEKSMHMALVRPNSECSALNWRYLGFIRKQMSWRRLCKPESSFIEDKDFFFLNMLNLVQGEG